MTTATEYVSHIYSLHAGRAAVTVGVDSALNLIHPFVYENEQNVPIGLVGLGANGVSVPTEVDIYHVSVFNMRRGHGSEIMRFLCHAADTFGVILCIQATVQNSGKPSMTDTELVTWYGKFDFSGDDTMQRKPLSSVADLPASHTCRDRTR